MDSGGVSSTGPYPLCGIQWVYPDSRLGIHAKGPWLALQNVSEESAVQEVGNQKNSWADVGFDAS